MLSSIYTNSAVAAKRYCNPVRSRIIPTAGNVVNGALVSAVRDLKFWRRGPCDGCRRANVDIPDPGDPKCPIPVDKKKPKLNNKLFKIKYSFTDGGTNFGTPFKRLMKFAEKQKVCVKEEELVCEKPPDALLPEPVQKQPEEVIEKKDGVRVTILGADTPLGHYIGMLLKQCSFVYALRLYAWKSGPCPRDVYNVAQDLHHMDTNCTVKAFAGNEIDMSLQNADIVLILDASSVSNDLPIEKRFMCQAPLVTQYAKSISYACPTAFVIVCATPVDCMVPLVAATLRESGFFDNRKLLGSMAVPEMRATTLAARALFLEPKYTRVPCVGGSETETLVPLFSKAVPDFDFAQHNAAMMTNMVRMMPWQKTRSESCHVRNAELSEAHALAKLVTSVAHALLCIDIPVVPGFVETDSTHLISPARYLAIDVKLNRKGILKRYDLPGFLSDYELENLDCMWNILQSRVTLAQQWYNSTRMSELTNSGYASCKEWNFPVHYDHIDDCNLHLT